MEEMRDDGGMHEEDGKHDEKKIDGRHFMEGIKWRRCERERRMMMGNEMHWRWRRMMRDDGDAKCGKEEQDDLLSWTRLDDERC